ncbi:MAG: hypothetical protein D6786_01065 [Gammaproteobacteria bacterium]|nr:MAG: hypothetical protein D6786_01065 [Gammaproteobacteria bacterium]
MEGHHQDPMYDYRTDPNYTGGERKAYLSSLNKPKLEELIGTPGTTFASIFGCGPLDDYTTLMEVLWTMSGSDEFHAVAAYFNASLGLYPQDTLSPQQVIDLYCDYKSGAGNLPADFDLGHFLDNTYDYCPLGPDPGW